MRRISHSMTIKLSVSCEIDNAWYLSDFAIHISAVRRSSTLQNCTALFKIKNENGKGISNSPGKSLSHPANYTRPFLNKATHPQQKENSIFLLFQRSTLYVLPASGFWCLKIIRRVPPILPISPHDFSSVFFFSVLACFARPIISSTQRAFFSSSPPTFLLEGPARLTSAPFHDPGDVGRASSAVAGREPEELDAVGVDTSPGFGLENGELTESLGVCCERPIEDLLWLNALLGLSKTLPGLLRGVRSLGPVPTFMLPPLAVTPWISNLPSLTVRLPWCSAYWRRYSPRSAQPPPTRTITRSFSPTRRTYSLIGCSLPSCVRWYSLTSGSFAEAFL